MFCQYIKLTKKSFDLNKICKPNYNNIFILNNINFSKSFEFLRSYKYVLIGRSYEIYIFSAHKID